MRLPRGSRRVRFISMKPMTCMPNWRLARSGVEANLPQILTRACWLLRRMPELVVEKLNAHSFDMLGRSLSFRWEFR